MSSMTPSLLSVVIQKISEHQPLRNIWGEQRTPDETSFPFEFIKNQRKAMIFSGVLTTPLSFSDSFFASTHRAHFINKPI